MEEKNIGFNSTFAYKLIYVFRINDKTHDGLLKIGDATIHTLKSVNELTPNCRDLNLAAKARINQYTHTAAISYELLHTELAVYKNNDKSSKKYGKILAFRDYDVHAVLKRSGIKNKDFDEENKQNEWYKCDLGTAKRAIQAIKNNQKALGNNAITHDQNPIVFRPEQRKAIEMTLKQFKKGNRMLWNAKMRFGKTLTALQVVKESRFRKTIIITHRPVVSDGWYDDFGKIFYDSPKYEFASKTKGKTIEDLIKEDKNFVYFASMQDLRGSELVGGNFDKNNIIFKTHWDFVVVDEAHEGTKTKLGEKVLESVIKANDKNHVTKTLELSGTPFNLLTDYENDEIFTWDYIMEQEAKQNWAMYKHCDSNPYEDLPRLNIFTYHLEENFKYMDLEDKAFKFSEFFRVWTGDINKDYKQMPTGSKVGNFVHEDDIKSFLNLICKRDPNTNYPFSTEQYRKYFRHTLWVVPGVKEAKALSALLKAHPVFSQFHIANVAGEGDEEIDSSNALQVVREAIGSNPDESYSITISCGRLTTGVTVPEWTAVLMLAGSYATQATQYLQTIFRVQSPANINGRTKDNCYVFDFAPDRTLKMIAESVQLSRNGEGTNSSEKKLALFLNYCSVISIDHTGMKEFKVSYLLQELKKAYAERVVRNGFDDTKLYNDELLKLTEVEINDFDSLKKIIGSSKAQEKTKDIDVNDEGFTEEQLEELKTIERKPKKSLTPEEKARLEELKEQRKKRTNAISILRGISIRIPLLVYGADVPLTRSIPIEEFPDLIDEQSWKEFMPAGVTKEIFKKFIKYYDKDIFIASTFRVRNIAKSADDLEPTERIQKLALLFGTFKNPDKETVLTPWRVVNLHLSDTIGGYDFFDEDYKEAIKEPRFVNRKDVTANIFNNDGKVLEINSKTGLYPLYVAYTFYRKRIDQLQNANISLEEKQAIWDGVISNNIYVICKTKMAKSITQRTLEGYRTQKINAHAFDDLINQLKYKQQQFADKVASCNFWNKEGKKMKFNAVVGNPPYQLENINNARKEPVYHYFYDTAFKISKIVTLISPARFLFNGGQTPSIWNQKMLNDSHISVIKYFENSHDVFPNVDIKGGVAILLRNEFESHEPIKIFTSNETVTIILNKVINRVDFIPLSTIAFPKSYYGLSDTLYLEHPELKEKFTKGNEYIVDAGIFSKAPSIFDEPNDFNFPVSYVLGREGGKRILKTIFTKYLKKVDQLGTYKVFITGANGTGKMGEELSEPVIGHPNELSTQTFMSFGLFKTEFEAQSFVKYIKTRFLRFLLGTLKITQNNPKETWSNIPLQDFSTKSDINWNKSVEEIDNELFKKYNFAPQEINWIKSNIKIMR